MIVLNNITLKGINNITDVVIDEFQIQLLKMTIKWKL